MKLALILAGFGSALACQTDSVNAGAICTEAGNSLEFACAPQFQGTYYDSQAVSDVVGGRVGPGRGPSQAEPVQYAPTGPAEDPAANAIIDEAVSTATNDEAMLWNAWIDASFINTDRDHSTFAYDGPMVTASAGLDRSFGESTVIGLLVNYEHVDFDTTIGVLSGSLQSDSFGIGAYGGMALTTNIVADAMFIYGWGDNDVVDVFGANSYDSERIQAAANLTGYWFHEAWRYSPAIGVTWSSEEQDAYAGGLVPNRKFESGVALASLQIGRTHFYDDVRWIEPWIGVGAEWEFYSSGVTSGVPGIDLDPFDLRVLGGINVQMGPSVTANVRADIAGLAREDYLVGTVGGQLAVRF